MFNAQYLFLFGNVFSPWMQRAGDNIIATTDVISIVSGVTLRVSVYTKNREDVGDGSSLGSFDVTSAGRHDHEFDDLKELVRYKLRALGPGADRKDYALFRMLSPVWFDDVRAESI